MPEDADTIDGLYRRHAPAVFRRARRLLGTDADADEVVQEVFLSLFERPDQYEGKSALTTFLYSVTTHACLNRIRNSRNRLRLLDTKRPNELDGATRALSPEELSLLHSALERMPSELVEAAVYYCVDDLSHDDIARVLGCSRRHVGHLLERVTDWGKAQEVTPC
jgi:RNA polymerase sigma-70 factor (ECF subfamily)